MEKDKNTAFISEVLTFWDKLSLKEKELIQSNMISASYSKGENIHSSDKECSGILLVKEGRLRIYMLSDEGREVTLYNIGKSEVCILSASCVIKNITFDVHIDADMDSDVLIISTEVFLQLAENNIYVENFVYKDAIERFSKVMWAVERILFMSMDKRLAIFLLDVIAESGTDTISLTHEEIARNIGSAREVVSRMLKYFAKEGLVELFRGGVIVIDKKRLRDIV